MSSSELRPTIRDIARQAGCHYSTVSLALRDHPRIPLETKNRIRAIAGQLGYRTDAMLAALCAYREMKRPAKEKGVIAWLTNHRTEKGWMVSACNRDYFQGASARAAERGYRLEQFWLAAPDMNWRRMSMIFWTRGIQGVLLPPQERLGAINLDWQNLSAVAMEIGVGIHGEPGRRRAQLQASDAIVDEVFEAVSGDLPFKSGDKVGLMINGLGGTPISELYVLYRRAAQLSQKKGLEVVRNYVGNYCTSLEMAGMSLTLIRLDDEIDSLLAAPAEIPLRIF